MNRISTPRTSPRHRLTVWHFAAAILAAIALVFSMLAGTGIAMAAGENEENANTSVSTLSEAIPTGNAEGTEADQAKAVKYRTWDLDVSLNKRNMQIQFNHMK